MFPMTPLQSWAFIILIFGAIIFGIYVLATAGRTAQSSTDTSADSDTASEADLEHDTDAGLPDVEPALAEVIVLRPHADHASAARQPRTHLRPIVMPELYDWAKQGL